jgi:trans-aconitate 2-methyltransferase
MSEPAGPRDWDAATYDRVAAPQEEWARDVLERLPLEGDETVLDAGCGSGRTTRLLLERLPRGRVIGVDASTSMIEASRRAFAGEPRVQLVASDLLDLELAEQVDAVFSNATFHWIIEHERLFDRLFAALRPGGRLEAQCGGRENVAEFLRTVDAVSGDERFAPYLRAVQDTWHFASPTNTDERLRGAGFEEVECRLEPRTVSPPEPREYLRAVCLGPHLELLPADLRDPFLNAVLESSLRPLTLDYVRLNISARRPE